MKGGRISGLKVSCGWIDGHGTVSCSENDMLEIRIMGQKLISFSNKVWYGNKVIFLK